MFYKRNYLPQGLFGPIKIVVLSIVLILTIVTGFFQPLQAQNWKKILSNLYNPPKIEKYSGQLGKVFLDSPNNVLGNYSLAIINKQAGDSKSLFISWVLIDRAYTSYQSDATFPPKSEINKYINNPLKRFTDERREIDSILWFKGTANVDLQELRNRIIFFDHSRYLAQYKARLTRLEYQEAKATNTLEAYERFLFLYPNATEAADAIVQRDVMEFETVREKDIIFVYNEFIARHPKSALIEEAIKIRDLKSYELVANTADLADLDFFIANYPTAPQVEDALQARYKLAFNLAVKANTIEGYQYFIEHNPLTKYIPEAVVRRDALVYAQLQQFADCGAYHLFMSGLPFADKAFRAFLDEYSKKTK